MNSEKNVNKENEKNAKTGRKNPLTWIVGVSTEHPGKTLVAFLIITILFLLSRLKRQEKG